MFEKKIARSEMMRCALCLDAPCSAACPALDPASLLRSVWFDNEKTAAARLPEIDPCANCPAPCEAACVRRHEVPIRDLLTRLRTEVRPDLELPLPEDEERLRTDLCGVPLENPFLLSSSVVASTYDMCARAFEAGCAGACFKTICSFDIHEASPRFSAITGDNGTIIGFKNIEQLSDHSVAENMEIFRRLKQNYPTKFILASIMGQDEAEWEELARQCEDPGLVERYTAAARRGTRLPILAKPTPNVATMSEAAEAAKRGGCDGFALINTIKSIIGVNPHTYISAPAVHGMSAVGGYSGNAVKPIALRFLAELGQNPKLACMHMSGMGGVENWSDALEFILLGAGSIQVTTAVMQYGYRIIDDLKAGLNFYLAEKGFRSVKEAVGLALDSVSGSTDVLERDTVIFPKFLRDRCIGCGRCVVSCADGGHQAITLNADRKPILNGKKCVGCHLCVLVCPQKAIRSSRRRITKATK